jgi:hypothetical protein
MIKHWLKKGDDVREGGSGGCEEPHNTFPHFSFHTPQVQYVLSDKTGTLTQNIMGFVWASIGGKMYGRADPDLDGQPAKQQPAAAAAMGLQQGPPHIPAGTAHTLVMDAELQKQLGSSWEAGGGAR